MQTTTDQSEINALFRKLEKGHADRDADAIMAYYAPDAVIFDLAPPLGRRGMNRDTLKAWFETWDSPIQLEVQDVNLTVEGDIAFASAFNRLRGIQSGRPQDLWIRSTLCLRKTNGTWRIVHDHTSVPFYMDGTDRAALDLKPTE